MLEGKCHHVLDAFDRRRLGVTRETLAEEDLDATEVVVGVPVVLVQQFSSEMGGPEGLQFPGLCAL